MLTRSPVLVQSYLVLPLYRIYLRKIFEVMAATIGLKGFNRVGTAVAMNFGKRASSIFVVINHMAQMPVSRKKDDERS